MDEIKFRELEAGREFRFVDFPHGVDFGKCVKTTARRFLYFYRGRWYGTQVQTVNVKIWQV